MVDSAPSSAQGQPAPATTLPRAATPPGRVPWAMCGFGSGGRVFHAPLIDSARGLDLVAVVTRDPARQAAACAAYPGAECVDSLAAAAALGVRGVTISTPPATHVPLALEAIALGLHVVVDKPFALDEAGARRIADAAAEAGVLAVPYFNRRFDDDFLTVTRQIRSGALGAVTRFESRLDRFRPVKPGWPNDPSRGGGLLLDLGPHLVDQALQLFGPALRVDARLRSVRPGAVPEDEFDIRLTHASGVLSVLSASLAAPATGPRFLVQGSAGGLRIEGFDVQEAQLKAGESPASLGGEWGIDDTERVMFYSDDNTAGPRSLATGRWDTVYPAVAAAVAGTGEPPAAATEAIAVAVVLDAARVSAERNEPVDLPATDVTS